IAQARGIASESLKALPEPTKPSEEMDLSDLIREIVWLSLMKLQTILDRPVGDDIERARLQARAALFLTKLYFDSGAFSARSLRRTAGVVPGNRDSRIVSECQGATQMRRSPVLFDHLVGRNEDRLRDGEPEFLYSLQTDD